MQPVRLVILIIEGPHEGENDQAEFPSIEDAVAYGREVYNDPRLQLEGIEDADGKLLVGYDYLNELCSEPPSSMPERRYG